METQPSGLLGGLGNVSMWQFLRVMLPLTVVFVLAFVLEYRAEVGADAARLFAQEVSAIQRGVRRIERELEIASEDLFFVGDLVTEAADDPNRLAALERSLLALMQHRPGYTQIRLIGDSGREVVRVENVSGGSRIVPENELQDQSDRSYFSNTVRLEPGELFVSPKEADAPMIRLATPIAAAGNRLGIVVLNAHAGRFLGAFEREVDEAGTQRMIVNSDGDWLQHPPEVERGFQRRFPEVWEQLVAMGKGRVESSDGLFHFDTVSLRPRASSTDDEGLAGSSWMLISVVPRAVVNATAVRVATRLLVIAVPLLFALLVLGWLLAAARGRRRLADEALRNAEYVRSAMMTAALDAIVVMDVTGTTVEFNPMARRIFGYTLDEARGKPVADLIIPPAHREAHRLGLQRFLETREGPFIDKHIDSLIGMRKDGTEFPVELTICPIYVAGKQLFFGFLRDLSEPGYSSVPKSVSGTGVRNA